MKMFSVAHKTAFVVDHCPYMAESSRQQVECDVLTKSRAQGVIPLAPVSKSLWTCAVECSMEYCRILYDVYPLNKLVSVDSRAQTCLCVCVACASGLICLCCINTGGYITTRGFLLHQISWLSSNRKSALVFFFTD